MKKNNFLSTIYILFILFNINGQKSATDCGFKTGANFAQYSNSNEYGTRYQDHKRKLGFYVGGFANIIIDDKIKIQPELIYAVQGTRVLIKDVEVPNPDGSFHTIFSDFEFNVNELTISVPVTLQYFFNERFYMELGPQLGFIINKKAKTENYLLSYSQFTGLGAKDDKFDLGLTFGIGYKLSENLRINSRYFSGLIKRNITIKSSVFNLGVEYKL